MDCLVEEPCPQCGAPVALEETARLLVCQYCAVPQVVVAPAPFRYVLPHSRQAADVLLAPYWRFRGTVYSCDTGGLRHRHVDTTGRGVDLAGLPASLGLRPQAMRLRFATQERAGRALPPRLPLASILARAPQPEDRPSEIRPLFAAAIGETVSLVYLPLVQAGRQVLDAVTGQPLAVGDSPEILAGVPSEPLAWRPTFLASLCPNCGAGLAGAADSLALACPNCQRLWAADAAGFRDLPWRLVPGQGPAPSYLPFWRIEAGLPALGITSRADFLRVTGQPRLPAPQDENEAMAFLVPAFKLPPPLFLTTAVRLALAGKAFPGQGTLPRQGLHGANLPRSEAVEALRLIVAQATVLRRTVLPALAEVRFAIQAIELCYLPFAAAGPDLVLEGLPLAVNKSALRLGSQL
ncbi:MAG: hypothetical protein AB1634_17605 [Thermodesulfobacteriota bacterium]